MNQQVGRATQFCSHIPFPNYLPLHFFAVLLPLVHNAGEVISDVKVEVEARGGFRSLNHPSARPALACACLSFYQYVYLVVACARIHLFQYINSCIQTPT